MIVEHTFVTTLEARDAFALANDALGHKGFSIADGVPSRSQQWRRGKKTTNRSRGVLKLPQSLRMEFDRGRINLAACIENDKRRKKKSQALMIAYAESLEALLVDHRKTEEAFTGSDAVEKKIRRGEMAWRITGVSLLLFVVGIIGIGIYGASRSAPMHQPQPARPRLASTPKPLPAHPQPMQPQPRINQFTAQQPPRQPSQVVNSSAPARPKTKAPPQVTVRRVAPAASKPEE